MAKTHTKRSPYPSRFGGPDCWVSVAQYVTEYVCELKAKREKKDLPTRFWDLPDWKKYFRFQIVLANRLLKEFSPDDLVRALKDGRAKYVYSLNHPVVRKLAAEYKEKPSPAPKPVEPVPTGNLHQTNPKGKQSLVSKLK
jgi:hypothetical protein